MKVSIGEHLFGLLKQPIFLLTPCVFSLQHILGSLVLKALANQQKVMQLLGDMTPHTPHHSDIFMLIGLSRDNRTPQNYNEDKVQTQS